jgi:hypothetical protein
MNPPHYEGYGATFQWLFSRVVTTRHRMKKEYPKTLRSVGLWLFLRLGFWLACLAAELDNMISQPMRAVWRQPVRFSAADFS